MILLLVLPTSVEITTSSSTSICHVGRTCEIDLAVWNTVRLRRKTVRAQQRCTQHYDSHYDLAWQQLRILATAY
jgi:hypothetical protein